MTANPFSLRPTLKPSIPPQRSGGYAGFIAVAAAAVVWEMEDPIPKALLLLLTAIVVWFIGVKTKA